MRVFITDIETNGFYFDVTAFHCAWIIDVATGRRKGFRPHEFKQYVETLKKADVVVYHNGIDYDLPVIAKLAGITLTLKVFDTLVLSRLLDPDRLGGHSLEAWGKDLGVLKGEYGHVTENAWENFTEDMFKYCEQDCEVLLSLYKLLCRKAGFDAINPPCNSFEFKEKL